MTLTPKNRPVEVPGITYRVRGPHDSNLFITVNKMDGIPFEVFVRRGRSDPCHNAEMEAVCRIVSLALRVGVPSEEIVKQLRGITCHPVSDQRGGWYRSEPDAIAAVLGEASRGPDDEITDNEFGKERT